MRICSLGSGSSGNAYILESQNTTLLIDCGFAYKTLKKRLVERFISPAEIDAVFITHEHTDHVSGLPRFLKEHKTTCYMSSGTARQLGHPDSWQCLNAGEVVNINDIAITPIAVPHDVAEPLQFVFECGDRRLAMFSDLGHVSEAVLAACRDVDVLMIECNYHPQMLDTSPYPESVKERIRSPYGHLSNPDACTLIRQTESARRHHIIATHLSANNNNPQHVQAALRAATTATLSIATQKDGLDWVSI